jgi:hypothetical protein
MHFDKATKTLRLTKRDVAALTTFASTDNSRPQLSSVLVEPSRGRVVATDGHRIVVVTACEGGHAGEAYLVARDELLKAAKLIDAKGELVVSATRVLVDQTTVRIQAGTSVSTTTSEEAKAFPAIEQILAERTAERGVVADTLGINAVYFNDLLLVQKAAAVNGVKLDAWTGKFDPIWFEAAGFEATWIGCIMPMHLD